MSPFLTFAICLSIAGYLAAYEKNKAALFETTDKMTIIGENFKKRLRAQIGGVK